MMRKRKNRITMTRRLSGYSKPKIVAFVLAALAVLLILIKVFAGGAEYMAEAASMTLSIETDAVIIRDESAYFAEYDFGKINFKAKEGELVKEGDSVATIFKLGYTEDVAQKLYDVQEKIYETQMKLMSGINKPEIDDAEGKIAELKRELQEKSEGNGTREIADIEKDIKTAIESRNVLLRDMVQPTEELNSLYEEEAARKKQLDEWTGRIISGAEGRFSCYTDGFEQNLCMSKIENLTASQIKKALEKKGYSTTGDLNNFMYRVVVPDHFCIGFLLKENTTSRTFKGEKYEVEFTGMGKKYQAECIEAADLCIDEKDNVKRIMCILEIKEDIGEFISMRNVKVKVSANVSGAKVDLDAIKLTDGKAYVNIVANGKNVEKTEVEVLATDKKYAIIRGVGGEKDFVGSWYSTRKD